MLKVIKRSVYLILSLILILFSAYKIYLTYSNNTYAKKYFDNLLVIKEIVGSKKWHEKVFGCTYAVVLYKQGHGPTLTSSSNNLLSSEISVSTPWIADWYETPYSKDNKYQDRYLEILQCLEEISPELYNQTIVLFDKEGSWYSQPSSEVMMFTSPQSNIAMFVRYGD